ncbi:MAG: Sortase domain [Chloroflexota bacterium]|jgi:hypothetical protein|nr:Sortase domain [Chloroflexota bacterium]
MAHIADGIRTRVLPALLTAFGVTLLVAGLMSYTGGAAADPLPSSPPPSPVVITAPPTSTPLITLPPLASLEAPTASPSAAVDRVATRVRIAALKIDLPVVKPPGGPNAYPLCNVAMYLQDLGQPGEGRGIYLYAHARTGMFLPLLDASKIQNGKSLLGMVVEVWTSDDQRFLYEISEVRRHQTDLNDAIAARTEELWLQTSEGPKGTPGKLQVVATPLSQEEAASPADAHPVAKPLVCG